MSLMKYYLVISVENLSCRDSIVVSTPEYMKHHAGSTMQLVLSTVRMRPIVKIRSTKKLLEIETHMK